MTMKRRNILTGAMLGVEADAMTDDLSSEAMTMIERDGGVHERVMPHERSAYVFCSLA